MKQNIHVENPDGEPVTEQSKKLDSLKTGADKSGTNDAEDNAAGPRANPDPRANANLPEGERHAKDTGPGTEVTDGEGG